MKNLQKITHTHTTILGRKEKRTIERWWFREEAVRYGGDPSFRRWFDEQLTVGGSRLKGKKS
ncbi:hypothetical protein OROGR_030983 [Orobanche gracilis]